MSGGVHVHFGGTAASLAAAPPIAEQQRMPGTASVPLPAAVASESAAAAAVNAGRVQLATAGDVVGELALFPELLNGGLVGRVCRADTAVAVSAGAAYVLLVSEEDFEELAVTFPEVRHPVLVVLYV